MARIPNDQLERIKQSISLVALVESEGYAITKQGKDHAIACPFHDDATPSLIVSPKTNLFNCFGCGAAGSVIDWVMKTKGVSFRHAVEVLQADHFPATAEKPVNRTRKAQLYPLFETENDNQTVLQQVIQFYHEALKQNPGALAYLDSRGLGDPELIDRFKLGYANRTLGYRLPAKRTKAGDALRGQLTDIGLYRESGHEHFNGSLIVPILDKDGNIVEAYGRKIRDDLRKGTPKHLYLPGPHKGVWNVGGLVGQQEAILCEALIDAMTFWVNGYKNVTASYGTQGFTVDHLAAFKECGIERVLIAYDRDEAGNTAAKKIAAQLQQEGFGCYRIELPKGMDVNSYALQVQPAPKSLGIVIRSAVWLGNPECKPTLEMGGGKNETNNIVIESQLEKTVIDNSVDILPPAEAMPDAPKDDIEADISGQDIRFSFGERNYRVRGLDKNKNFEVLKVNLLASYGEGLHVDTFDIYASKHRHSFIKLAALELALDEGVIKKDVGKVLLKLEELQEKNIQGKTDPEPNKSMLSEDEKSQALALLRDPDLLNRILSDFSRCGVVGEETNKLVGYLAAGSRKLDKPLAVIIQSTSAAGKSSLMDAVLNLMPENERVQYSAMTGQSLFYMGETNLKNKILAIAEEEGASNASYALKLLQSEGEITIASTGKNDTTGDLETKEYKVQGPVMLFLTTTAIDIDEELLNRCLVLTVNESREQTQAIHQVQRKGRTLEGLHAKLEKEQLVKLHRNAQSLLRPLSIINHYADQLSFRDDLTRTRRDHEKYLTLIDSIALLHQYQREVKTIMSNSKAIEYIEVQLSDIETANRLAHEVLGRTLDELPPQTRKLLKLIQVMVNKAYKGEAIEQKDYRFSRRDIRAFTRWGNTQLKVHLKRLEEMEYLLIHRGCRGQSYEYELLYDANEKVDKHHLMGLIDIENLPYDKKKSGLNTEKAASGRPQVGGQSDAIKSLHPSSHQRLNNSGSENVKSTSVLKNSNVPIVSAAAV